MKTFSFYHAETGIFSANRAMLDEAWLAANTPAGYATFEGIVDAASQRMDIASGQVVAWQPPSPSNEENLAMQAAILEVAVSKGLARRGALLAASDWTQLPDVAAVAWRPYRQALRDLTTQAGWPLTVVWPSPPAYFSSVQVKPE